MSVNSVSFGKITVVNAPMKIANKIASIANNEAKTKTDKQIKNIIDDTNEGQARACLVNGKHKAYIFSGKEGEQYWNSYCSTWENMNAAYLNNRIDADFITDKVWENHRNFVIDLINSAEEIQVLDIKYNKSGDIKSVDIIA